MTKLPIIVTAVALLAFQQGPAAEPLRLDNGTLALDFDAASGTLTAIGNRLTGETYVVSGDAFAIDTSQGTVALSDTALTSLEHDGSSLSARYEGKGLTVEVGHLLGRGRHFVERQIVVTSDRELGVTRIVLGQFRFSTEGLEVVSYRQPQLMNPKDQGPIFTCFGRTGRGGFFCGVELPFDASSHNANTVVLAYRPNLTIRAGERLTCEPAYSGIYRKGSDDVAERELPLRSESDAMVAMTAAILPPQQRRLGPLMCGWWSELYRGPYRTGEDVENHLRAMDFALDCGIDIISDPRTWAGELDKINVLREGEELQLGELALKVAASARQKGARWVFWPTMGNSDPWGNNTDGDPHETGGGRVFRRDKPEWQMQPFRFRAATCFAFDPFFEWLTTVNRQAMEAGQYGAWCMDGDFFGEPGFGGSPGFNGGGAGGKPEEPWVHPARCENPLHDHLAPDTNYICQRNLTAMVRGLRQQFPELYIFHCRPAMDLGVWAMRHADASFTVNEWAALEGIPGMGPRPVNVLLGDKIRHWGRIRVQHHFFPHYLDSPQVFAAPKSMPGWGKVDWQRDKLDYILLSALSSSPNQTYYLPTQAGIPAEDKREIKKWLDWGRANIDYLFVRKDLPDWPAPGKVDGSAHIVGNRGLVFLFNPNDRPLAGQFTLTEQSIGIVGNGPFQITQEYPASDRTMNEPGGQTIRWEVPPQTAVVLRVQ
ncbi:hypothetical protein FJY94_04925 [Candidatus Kaiserbacteria bacterium]|nr:hypothetical protein [Candidatus Kaiserbacteria bacterium]